MEINIYLNNDRTYECNNLIIGKTYENEATKLWFMLDEEMYDKDFYLEFEKIDGTKFSTPKLEIQEEVVENVLEGVTGLTLKYVEYAIPNSLLDIAGDLKVEVVLRKDGTVFKTYTMKFTILNSINASEDMPNQYPDFISEAQQVIDLVKTDGTGEKYLSDNGTYKEVSGGTTDYNNLSNKPIKYLTGTEETPIYFNNLETGLYIFNGTCQPYKDADLTGFANNIFAQVLKTDEYISLMYDDLTNKPTIPTVPTKISAFTNDKGYLTAIPSEYITETELSSAISGKANASDIPNISGLETKTDASSKLTEAKTYTDTKVANLVGTAPTTLDTLQEIAEAIQNNETVVSTLNNAIGNKANKSDLATVATTGSYSDLKNKPTIFSGNYNDLTNKPSLFSGSYNDLTNKPTIYTAVTKIWE